MNTVTHPAIVFVDSRVMDIDTLLTGFEPGTEVVMLDAQQDGLSQIATFLAGRSDIDAVHVISHGAKGMLQLGSLVLSNDNIESRAVDLATIGAALSADADILLYGCDTASGSGGEALVHSVARLTGADVAASIDVTGSAALGGNWALEYQSGTIEATTLAVSNYSYLLIPAAPVITFSGFSFDADSGVRNNDFITKVAAQTVTATLSGTLAIGEVVYGSLDAGAHWTDITSKVSGSTLSWNGVTLNGSNLLQLKVQDSLGRDGSVSSRAYTLDTSAPTMTITSSVGHLGPGQSATITFTTSEATAGFGAGDVTIFGGTLSNFAQSSNQVYTATYTPTAASSGTAQVNVGTGAYSDIAGNPGGIVPGLTLTFDTSHPAIASVTVPSNGTYRLGEALEFTVNLTGNVTVNTTGGVPSLALALNTGGTVQASYVSGSGTSALRFSYIVSADTADADGISLASTLSLNGGTLRDVDGNDLNLTLNSVASTSHVNVNGLVPRFDSASVNGNSLVIAYNETTALDAVHAPAGSDYTVLVAGVANAVTALAVDSTTNTVTLTLATAVAAGQSVTVAYTDPSFADDINALQNTIGNDAVSFSPVAVSNITAPASGGGTGGTGVVITAPMEGGVLNGSPYNDTLVGQAGKDIFHPNGGADTINGGGGIDSVVFGGARNEYTVTHNSDGTYTVRSVLGPSVEVAMTNIERLHFSDQLLAIDATPASAQLAGLYHLALGRNPDDGGLQYHLGVSNTGVGTRQIITSFVASNEFTSGYGQLSNTAFLTQLYGNAFGRAPDTVGLAYWQEQLLHVPGTEGRAQVIEGFLAAGEMTVLITGQVDNGIALLLQA